MSPPFHLRRLLLLWLPLLAVGAILFAQIPFYAGLWTLIPITCVGCAIVAELTEPHPTR